MTDPKPSRRSPRRLAPAFTTLYGVLSLFGGVMGYRKGSLESLVVGGGLGLVLVVAGVLMFRGRGFGWVAAQWATLAVVTVAIYRLLQGGLIAMWVPIIATGIGLSFVIWSERPDPPPPPV
jgi:uncharacterized membrane protein (UPF0136 family)